MSGSPEVVHVVWGVSRSESLREALRSQGHEAEVVALCHVLNVGPIDPPEPAVRRAWAEANLRDDDPDRGWHEPEAPWVQATSPGVHPVYWVCLSDAAEHASFLAFASRMSGRPFDVVDVTGTGASASGTSPVRSLGQLRPDEIAASGLHARRRPFSREESEAASAAWSRLRRENAPLRVMRGGRLVSAPLTHFDPALTGQATPGWEPVIALVARTLDHLASDADEPGRGIGDDVLFARILALGEAGTLGVRGAGPGMRDYEVRLPAPGSPA